MPASRWVSTSPGLSWSICRVIPSVPRRMAMAVADRPSTKLTLGEPLLEEDELCSRDPAARYRVELPPQNLDRIRAGSLLRRTCSLPAAALPSC